MASAKTELVLAGESAVAELVSDGLSKKDAKAIVVSLLDGVLAFKLLVPGPGGMALEALDGPAIAAVLDKLDDLFRRDPDNMERRADVAEKSGDKQKAKRIRVRAKRVRTRQG